jgi:hypothetical protein
VKRSVKRRKIDIVDSSSSRSNKSSAAASRWTYQDDLLIAHLKEVKKCSWREIAEAIHRRHTWQAIQMRYLRSLKSRNNPFTPEEDQKFEIALINDWKTRWKRISADMGPAFSEDRCARRALQMAGLDDMVKSELIEEDVETGIPRDTSKLPERAVKYLELLDDVNFQAVLETYTGLGNIKGENQ